MTFVHRFGKVTAIAILAFGLAGCASHYDRRSTNTMLGAGLGAATGAVVSQGNPWMTVGGAAAGGLLGNILTEDRKERPRGWNRGNGRGSHHHAHDRGKHGSHGKRDHRHR